MEWVQNFYSGRELRFPHGHYNSQKKKKSNPGILEALFRPQEFSRRAQCFSKSQELVSFSGES